MRHTTARDRDRTVRIVSVITGGLTAGAIAATGAATALAAQETHRRDALKLAQAEAAGEAAVQPETAAPAAPTTSTHVLTTAPSTTTSRSRRPDLDVVVRGIRLHLQPCRHHHDREDHHHRTEDDDHDGAPTAEAEAHHEQAAAPAALHHERVLSVSRDDDPCQRAPRPAAGDGAGRDDRRRGRLG